MSAHTAPLADDGLQSLVGRDVVLREGALLMVPTVQSVRRVRVEPHLPPRVVLQFASPARVWVECLNRFYQRGEQKQHILTPSTRLIVQGDQGFFSAYYQYSVRMDRTWLWGSGRHTMQELQQRCVGRTVCVNEDDVLLFGTLTGVGVALDPAEDEQQAVDRYIHLVLHFEAPLRAWGTANEPLKLQDPGAHEHLVTPETDVWAEGEAMYNMFAQDL